MSDTTETGTGAKGACPGGTPDGWTLLGKTAAAEFSGVTDAGEPFAGSFTTYLYECPTCLAVVAASELHEKWHREEEL